MKMKLFFKNIWILAIIGVVFSCNESEDLVTENALEGGLVEPTAVNINYVVGNQGPYQIEFYVNQAPGVTVQNILMYKSFTGTDVYEGITGDDSLVSYTTNEILERTLSVTETSSHFLATEISYGELIAGLTRDDQSAAQYLISAGGVGGVLPTDDTEMIIGDTWTFRFEFELSDGRTVQPNYTISMAFSTRFAGTYAVKDKDYFRIGVDRSDLDGFWPETMDIASIDAITYELIEWVGLFDGNTTYFQISSVADADGNNPITYPEVWAGVEQTGNGQPVITCDRNATDMTNVPCGAGSNIAISVDSGKDILEMSFGYLTPGSGPREFYQSLEKVL